MISSLCIYAKINDLGFIVTPYRTIHDHKVDMDNKDVVYLTAEEEEEKPKFCQECGKPLDPDAAFCKYCGTKC